MNLKKRIKYIIDNPITVLIYLIQRSIIFRLIPDIIIVKLLYRIKMKRKLNIKNPKTYNEKILWLMLYNHNPLYTSMVDKYEMRSYVKEKLGVEFLVPLVGVYDGFDDINFNDLPNRFVIKCTHDSGGVFICKNKADINIDEIKKKIEKRLKVNYYYDFREWPYKNVKPRIICEQFIETDDENSPRDYKFFCFDGEPKFFIYISDRGNGTKVDIYDMSCSKMPVKRAQYPCSNYDFKKPKRWEDMIYSAKVLSEGIPHVRVDMYEDKNGNILVGELTFTPASGMQPFEPEKYDDIFGEFIKLPIKD